MLTSGSESERQPEMLVRTFFEEATTAFQPLIAPSAGQWRLELRHASSGDLEHTTPDKIRGFFFAECEFRTRDLMGAISYGDRDYLINTIVGPVGHPSRYGLWEWAEALEQGDLVPQATDWVLQLDRVRGIVREMGHALVVLAPDIARADRAVLGRIERARASARAAHEAQLREAEHRGRVHLANDAFREQRWAQVVELLQSVQALLTPAEAKKLAYARKRVAKGRRPRA